jgi:hypothetical protein
MADKRGGMKKTYYDASSLEDVLRLLEERHGLSSEDFLALVDADEPTPEIPGFTRHVWASFYREALTLRHSDFAGRAARVLAVC